MSNRSLRLRLLAAVGSCCLATACGSAPSAAERIQKAEQLLVSGQYGAAEIEIGNSLTAEPNNHKALLLLAEFGLKAGNLTAVDEALAHLDTGPTAAAEVAELRARLMLARGQYTVLQDAIDKGTIAPPAPLPGLYKAEALRGQGKWQAAADLYTEVLAQNARLTMARLGLATCLQSLGDAAGAAQQLNRAVADVPDSAVAWLALGNFQLQQMDGATAEKSLQTALQHAPGQLPIVQHIALISALAEMRMAAQDVDGAAALHEALVKVSPQGVPTVMLSAQLAVARGKLDDAVMMLTRLTDKAPELQSARAMLASAMLAQGAVEQGNTELERLANQHPEALVLKLALASSRSALQSKPGTMRRGLAVSAVAVTLNQLAVARHALANAARGTTEDPAEAAALLSLDLRVGRNTETLADAVALRRQFPREPGIPAATGQAHERLQQFAQAEADYAASWALRKDAGTALALYRMRRANSSNNQLQPLEELLAQRPAEAGVRAQYAEALLMVGEKTRALQEYEKLRDVAPPLPIALNNLARLYAEAGDPRALETSRRAYQAAGGISAIADTYGWLLVQSGKVSDGLPILKTATEHAPADRNVAYHYAAALARGGNKEQARRVLTAALLGDQAFASRADAAQLLKSL